MRNSKVWTLETLEQLSDEDLAKLIPSDIESQYNRLPKEKGGFSPRNHPGRYLYTKRQGYIQLLDGSRLFIDGCDTKFGV